MLPRLRRSLRVGRRERGAIAADLDGDLTVACPIESALGSAAACPRTRGGYRGRGVPVVPFKGARSNDAHSMYEHGEWRRGRKRSTAGGPPPGRSCWPPALARAGELPDVEEREVVGAPPHEYGLHAQVGAKELKIIHPALCDLPRRPDPNPPTHPWRPPGWPAARIVEQLLANRRDGTPIATSIVSRLSSALGRPGDA